MHVPIPIVSFQNYVLRGNFVCRDCKVMMKFLFDFFGCSVLEAVSYKICSPPSNFLQMYGCRTAVSFGKKETFKTNRNFVLSGCSFE